MRRMILVVVSILAASLLVVTPALAAPASLPASTPPAAPPAWGTARYHVVRPGETLFSIGRLYGVNPWAIASANRLYDPNRIYIGQCLYIPASTYYSYYPYYGSCSYYRCPAGNRYNTGYRW